MYKKIFTAFILIFGLSYISKGQSTRDIAPPPPPVPQYQSYKKAEKKDNILKGWFQKSNEDEVLAFRKKMKKVYKKKRKNEKLAEKPEFNDPLYFGHKKPPVKRPLGKRKFCKECGMKH